MLFAQKLGRSGARSKIRFGRVVLGDGAMVGVFGDGIGEGTR